MHSHTTEGLMQLVSEFGQCRWSEGDYGASFIAKVQERGQREEAAKLYEEIRSYATALCQQGERDAKDAARWRMLPAFLEEHQINYVRLVRDIDAALSTSEGKTE